MAYLRINLFDKTKRDAWSFNTNFNKFLAKFKLLEKYIIFIISLCYFYILLIFIKDKMKVRIFSTNKWQKFNENLDLNLIYIYIMLIEIKTNDM